jgi:hypothetical protein
MANQTTALDVKNLALIHIGAGIISSENGSSKEQKNTKLIYPLSRDEMMELPINWHFLTTRAQLNPHTDDPATGYDYQYVLPSDSKKVIAMVDEHGDEIEYDHRIEAYKQSDNKIVDVLQCNETTCFIKYIINRDDPSDWPAWFVRLVYLDMAVKMCEPLKQDYQKFNQLEIWWRRAYLQAKASNGQWNAKTDLNAVRTDDGNDDVLWAPDVSEPRTKYIETT